MPTKAAIIAMVLCGTTMSLAQTTLKVGDVAPAISVENWVKGQEVTGFEKGRVYVVEFWATWCMPCIKNIPHLSELQTQYKDAGVSIIGVAASERGDDDSAKLKGVADFVKSREKDIAYDIAYDSDRSMSRDWMKPAGRNTIPTAFVVNKEGKITFIGNPADGLDAAIEAAAGKQPAAKPVAQPAAKPADKPSQETKPVEKQPSDKPFALMVGDKAPELAIGTWVKGEPITGFEKGKVYVVEFWATWCGPCINGMPHLTELSEEYKDKGVRFVGVNIWDDPKNVEPFMKERKARDGSPLPSGNELMGYTVAIEKKYTDDGANIRNGLMAADWMAAAGQRGIPSAFIVDKTGTVAWIGHPMSMDKPLEEIVAGKFDVKAEAKKYAAKMAAEAVVNKMMTAYRAQDWEATLAAYDEVVKVSPDAAVNYIGMKFDVLINKKSDTKAAYAFAREALVKINDNSMALNQLAWTIVDPDGTVKDKDLDLAMKAALRANELTKGNDAAIVDTVARVYFCKGDIAKAIELQTKAVSLATGEMKAELQKALDEYKKAQGPG